MEFVGDIADAVQRADSEEFRIECLGILGNLTIPGNAKIKSGTLVP